MQCLIIDEVDPVIAEGLGRYMRVDDIGRVSETDLKERIPAYDVLIMRTTPNITAEILDAAKNLKMIGVCSVGLDHIDMEKAKEKGVIIQNAPGRNANAVAELTICKMLELSRDTIAADSEIKTRHIWDKYRFVGRELSGKTLGVLGFGRIGQRVGQLARAFGMKVIAYDPYLPKEIFVQQEAVSMGIYDVVRSADYVTIHMPLTEETRGLINADEIARMKNGAVIINMSRGSIVCEQDVYEALKSGKLGGYGTDVMEEEQTEDLKNVRSPLFACANFIVTPHAGAETAEAMHAIGQFILTKCEEDLNLK